MAPWLQYLLAVIVFAHGFIYVGPLSPVRGFTAWTGRSWLLGGVLTGDSLRVLAWSLHILTAVATIGCAASIAFASMVPGWWRPLAIASGWRASWRFWCFGLGRTIAARLPVKERSARSSA